MALIEEPQTWESVRTTLSKFTGRIVKVIVILMLSIGLDAALTVGLLSAYSELHRTQNDLKQAQADLETTQAAQEQFLHDRCEAANDAATRQHQLWDSVIAQSGPPATPEAEARVEAFRKTLDEIFFQRDCNQELQGKGTP